MRYCIAIIVVVMLAMYTLNTQADIGPKPTIHIDLQYLDDPEPVLTSVKLLDCKEHLECEDPFDFYEKNVLGPNTINWNQYHVFMMAYDFPKYSKLRLRFKEFELESPIVQTKGLKKKLIFKITGQEIAVEQVPRETTSRQKAAQEIGIALGLTLFLELLFLELLFGWILLYERRERKKLMLALLIGNIISLPVFVWLPSYWVNLESASSHILLIGEAIAVVFEASLLWLAGRPNLSGLKAFGISLLLNVSSFLIGDFLLFLEFNPIDKMIQPF